jgi:hypothetical protein|tara:strand:- start:75 stop:644 length:570 start_codon:yes stop_codon:yes gene_type:complete
MTTRSVQRREYAEFKQMLERALSEIRLPPGIVDTDNIKQNAVTPSNCRLSASWEFSGLVSAGGRRLNTVDKLVDDLITERDQEAQDQEQEKQLFVELENKADLNQYPDADVFFLNCVRSAITLRLPPASEHQGRKLFFKRIDPATNNICRILCTAPDKLDGTDGVELGSKQAVILIASSKHWYVFSKLN